ncbi:hypothetical protein MMC25_006545, partial [Agyrium rufum]|nr:hypothetical protein [Agyrium rufum]
AISIANLRTLSFSDDSANVDVFPSKEAVTPLKGDAHNDRSNSVLMESLTSTYNLRHIMSRRYYALMHTSQSERLRSWHERRKHINELEEWLQAIPPTVPIFLKDLLEAEMLHGCILLIWPPNTPNNIDSHGKSLLFKLTIRFVNCMARVMGQNRFEYASVTSLDLLRAVFVGQRFAEIIGEDDPLSNAELKNTLLTSPEGSLQQGTTVLSSGTRRETAMQTLTSLCRIMDLLSDRFGAVPGLIAFKANCSLIEYTMSS